MVIKINDLVEVCTEKFTGIGEVHWMGFIPEKSRDEPMVGIVITVFHERRTDPPDGVAHGKKYFTSPPRQGVFAYRQQVSKLDRYPLGGQRMLSEILLPRPMNSTGVGTVANETKSVAGIVGYKNSSYMDCTLLCMFGFSTDYDPCICRRLYKVDKNIVTVQHHLRNIVREIRTSLNVPWQDIMPLRKVLDLYDGPNTWSAAEVDPCHLLNILFTKIMHVPRFLGMSVSLENGQDKHVGGFRYLTIDSTGAPGWRVPPLQDLFDATVAHNNAFLDEIPKQLILELRETEYQKHGGAIHPSFELDITNILRAHPKQCGMCGTCALYQCRDCYLKFGNDLNTTYFCQNCHAQCHQGLGIKHSFRRVMANHGFQGNFSSRVVMELCALLCRKGDHYMAYAKCEPPAEYQTYIGGEWYLFDSMHEMQGQEGKPLMKPATLDGFTESASAYRLELLQNLGGIKDSLDYNTANFFQNGHLAFYNKPKFLYY